jgi:putative nucleotidyltransferase with HDIG domain
VEGRHDEALAHFQRALQGYRALGLDARAAAAWSNIGKAYTALGRFSRARRAHNRALAICERVGDRAQALRACANLAELHVTRGRYAQAERLCAEVLAAPGAGASQWEAEAHLYAGIATREMESFDDATAHFAAAERIAQQRGDPLLSAETAREQATLLVRQGRNADAFAQLRIAYAHFERLRARRGLVDIEQRFARFEQQFLFVVEGWGRSLEICDPYTRGHCDRVAELATRLAASVGFDQRTLFWFRIGALLHDIGKMRLPTGVLAKPGPLTPAERAAMQRHPEEGVALLGNIEFPWDVRPMIRGHHERWDGSGYPDRLAGEQIPLAARILTIADVYDALTTTRSYRAAHDHSSALEIMRSERGTTFDPMLFDSFVSILGRMQEAA